MPFESVLKFYSGKKVLVTGNTGFKGSWLSFLLQKAGAEITGYSLEAPTEPSLFDIAGLSHSVKTVSGDVRDYDKLFKTTSETKPDLVFHLAAQPIVLDGYQRPRYTYETNVMGTVNMLEAIRHVDSARSVVNVTTDKVYFNREDSAYGYKETDRLNGFDPYSNSKSCSELITQSYINSFFQDGGRAVSTARAGNVIGGGDFASNRIIPDCVRALKTNTPLVVRNSASIRPYQHVLEPLFAYLLIAKQQYENIEYAGSYNVGPDEDDCVTTEELVELFARYVGEGFRWKDESNKDMPHEASFLKLDSSKLKTTFDWAPRWHIDQAVEKTVAWTKSWIEEKDIKAVMERQIEEYVEGRNNV